MTELQLLRNALFDELSRVKRGTSDDTDTRNIIGLANVINNTYSTEIKACEVLIKAQETGADLKGVSVNVFKEDDKRVIDYKAQE